MVLVSYGNTVKVIAIITNVTKSQSVVMLIVDCLKPLDNISKTEQQKCSQIYS